MNKDKDYCDDCIKQDECHQCEDGYVSYCGGKQTEKENREELNFQLVKSQLKEYDDEISKLKNDKYKLNKYYIELLQEKCRENIGRCFKKLKGDKIISYCKIIDIDKVTSTLTHGIDFNEYQYPAIWFVYPYNNSKIPFIKDNLFSGAWGKGNNCIDSLNGISYIEISKEEYDEKFSEVNSIWIEKVKNI